MDRRPLSVLLASGLLLTVPAVAPAASLDVLMAQGGDGTLTDNPGLAQGNGGTLSDAPKETGAGSSSTFSSSTSKRAAPAAADALPFTGSDPRITLLLGLAALLAGAGLRLRTGDARDF